MIGRVPEADALIVATTDKDHYSHAIAGLERGWHLLLAKPISPDPRDCLKIAQKAD
jgi:predicted dehydrogenase